MIPRYTRQAMQSVWTLEAKYQAWLKVELAVLTAYIPFKLGITLKTVRTIKQKVRLDVDKIALLEETTRHDVVAFTRYLSTLLGPEKRWVHYGLTSTDVVDTAQSLQLQAANKILRDDLHKLKNQLAQMAKKYVATFQMGRTHGMHAEITTFGFTLAQWYDEIQRQTKRFERAAQEVEVAKVSGAVGNYAHMPVAVQDEVAKALCLTSVSTASQVVPRDRHAFYLTTLALVGASLEKFATNIRHWQRTEVNEVAESFNKGQTGSSAMPHKKNPIGSENICGLARLLRGYAVTATENVALWHERDISHSSAERVILPDATIVLDYILHRFTNILANLTVYPEQMMGNIKLSKCRIFSQRVLLYLVSKQGYTREEAYSVVQNAAHTSRLKNECFFRVLTRQKILNKSDVDALKNLNDYTKNIKKIFTRLKLS